MFSIGTYTTSKPCNGLINILGAIIAYIFHPHKPSLEMWGDETPSLQVLTIGGLSRIRVYKLGQVNKSAVYVKCQITWREDVPQPLERVTRLVDHERCPAGLHINAEFPEPTV